MNTTRISKELTRDLVTTKLEMLKGVEEEHCRFFIIGDSVTLCAHKQPILMVAEMVQSQLKPIFGHKSYLYIECIDGTNGLTYELLEVQDDTVLTHITLTSEGDLFRDLTARLSDYEGCIISDSTCIPIIEDVQNLLDEQPDSSHLFLLVEYNGKLIAKPSTEASKDFRLQNRNQILNELRTISLKDKALKFIVVLGFSAMSLFAVEFFRPVEVVYKKVFQNVNEAYESHHRGKPFALVLHDSLRLVGEIEEVEGIEWSTVKLERGELYGTFTNVAGVSMGYVKSKLDVIEGADYKFGAVPTVSLTKETDPEAYIEYHKGVYMDAREVFFAFTAALSNFENSQATISNLSEGADVTAIIGGVKVDGLTLEEVQDLITLTNRAPIYANSLSITHGDKGLFNLNGSYKIVGKLKND